MICYPSCVHERGQVYASTTRGSSVPMSLGGRQSVVSVFEDPYDGYASAASIDKRLRRFQTAGVSLAYPGFTIGP